MRVLMVISLLGALFLPLTTPSLAADCDFSLTVSDPSNTGLAEAARARIKKTLAANGCHEDIVDPIGGFNISFTITDADADRKFNPVGLLFAGGYSSGTKLNVEASVSLEAVEYCEQFFSETINFHNSPHELFSSWRKARAVKKRAVEDAADTLIVRLLKERNGDSAKVTVPPRSVGDFLNEDRDFWPILGAAFTDIAIHESGHFFNARLTGHKAVMQGNDHRTFNVGPHTVLGLTALFTHHVGDDQLFMMPDVLYDFSAVETPAGFEYRDENGATVSGGRRDHALIAYSGILFQNIANEAILTRHPRLIGEDAPFLKGMVFFNLFIPAFYTFEGRNDFNSDLRMLRQDLGYDKWAVNALVLAPAALDMYRYYHPEKKRLRAWSRIAKVVPVIICLSR